MTIARMKTTMITAIIMITMTTTMTTMTTMIIMKTKLMIKKTT